MSSSNKYRLFKTRDGDPYGVCFKPADYDSVLKNHADGWQTTGLSSSGLLNVLVNRYVEMYIFTVNNIEFRKIGLTFKQSECLKRLKHELLRGKEMAKTLFLLENYLNRDGIKVFIKSISYQFYNSTCQGGSVSLYDDGSLIINSVEYEEKEVKRLERIINDWHKLGSVFD